MPAIQPARLKIQAAQLAHLFDQPQALVRGLHDLLEFYADRTYRPGQATQRALALLAPAYRVPAPVLRQIASEMLPFAEQDPAAALTLSQALWQQPYLEFRQLAATLLGAIRPAPAAPLLTTLDAWVRSSPDENLLHLVLERATPHLWQQAPSAIAALVETWLHASERPLRRAGLNALRTPINDATFDDLPMVFRLLSPWVRAVPSELKPDVLEALTALCQRSPSETAHFLIENLHTPEHPATPWFIRQILGSFPPHLQASLRQALQQNP